MGSGASSRASAQAKRPDMMERMMSVPLPTREIAMLTIWDPPSRKPRVLGPAVAAEAVPDYVATGAVECDLCGKKSVRFGFHAEPNTDLCMDCHHRFCNDRATDVDAFVARSGLRPGQTKFVQFQPLR
jgi:hypothetical protein